MKIGILSVDPGKASGIAFITWNGDHDVNPVLEWSDEVDADDYAERVRDGLKQGAEGFDVFLVVYERFTINQQTVRNSQAPYSLEQIGVLKQLCREAGYDLEKVKVQAPVDAKNMFPNPALKKLETWHRGGEGHALDAIRHALLALARQSWIPRALLNNEK
jgi:hypothetical protein